MSEFRQDLVSGDWILVAPGRGKRPGQFKVERKRRRAPKKGCPFEDPKKAGGGAVILSLPDDENWKLQVVPNKYPAVSKSGMWALDADQNGPFHVLPGYGYHELVITKDHDDSFGDLAPKDALLVFEAFQERYRILAEDTNVSYVQIYANWGESAGATIYHPHYQILAIPVTPPDIERSLRGSLQYFKKNKGACVHCTQIAWEIEQKQRIICENEHAVVFAPYVSKEPFEMRVFPKKHSPFFEDANRDQMEGITDALQAALKKLKGALSDPDYNFFIHTAATKNREEHKHYHWHIEIFPRTEQFRKSIVPAGFELSTAIEINPLNPDEAASFLRDAK